MLIDSDGRPVSVAVHYPPPPPPKPPEPPKASDVSTAKQALQKQLGTHAPDDGAALAAAIKKIQQENALLTEEALARAAILLQQQYDASHHQPLNPKVDPIKEAASQVGLTHWFDTKTLDAAATSLSGSALATTPTNGSSNQPTVSLGDARGAIQSGLDNGLNWQEAVNAARVQFGGASRNEAVLDEAALTIKGDQLAAGSDAKTGNVLSDASQQLAGLHLFDGANNKAAVAALTLTPKPSKALAADAKSADSAWATLQHDRATHASALTIQEDTQIYHSDLDTELSDAANQPDDGTPGAMAWLNDPSKSDLRWQSEQAVVSANTATGLHGAPSANALLTSLRASQIVDTAYAARGTGASNAANNLKAAQTLTQKLQGVPTQSELYKEVMGDMRIASLHDAALADITGAHADNPQDTLTAEGNALSGYRHTVLFQSLAHDTLASATTQHNLQAVGTPGKLTDIANLLDPVAKASPELAQALAAKLQGKVSDLIGQGPPYTAGEALTPEQMDSYYGPISRIVDAAGGPRSASAKPLVNALKTQLEKQQQTLDEEKKNPATAAAAETNNPFQALAYLHIGTNDDPDTVYQYLINQAPTSGLAKTLEQFTKLNAQPAPAASAKNAAGTLASAQIALNNQLNNGPVNGNTLQKALAAARKKDPTISEQTWAEAALAQQAQSDAAASSASKKSAPPDLIAQASTEVTNDQLFDADTMSAATGALQSGKIADGGLEPQTSMSLQPGQPNAAQYMQNLVSGGMTMPEAIALTRAWLSGTPETGNPDLVLTQAALTVGGQQYLQTYYSEPNGADPIDHAAQQLKKMGLIDPATVDLAVNGRPAANGQPAVTGMKQNVKPNLTALAGKNGKPGLIDNVNTAYSAWQTAQAKANKAGASANDKTAAQKALQTYHTALSSALNAAAGHAPTDSGWQSNPLYTDTMWKAQNELELAALAPQIAAAQSAGQHSPQAAALETAFQQWQMGLDALQIVGRVQAAQQAAAKPGDPSSGDVAAAQALTEETYGLDKADPQLYQQVMGDATVANLASSVLANITSQAALPEACTVDGNDSPNPKARLHAEGTRLQAYEGTSLYAQLIDGVAKDPTTQQLFSTIAANVDGQKSDADKLKTLADTLEGTSPDLAALLVHQMFPTGGRHSTFSPSQLVAWTKNANDLTQISRIYVAAGGAQNADMTAMRKSLETMITGNENFGTVDYSSRLNTQYMASEGGAVVWGEGLDLANLKKNGVQMQLAQDMLDDAPNSDLGVEIARETGFKNLGAPATPVSTTGNGATTLANDASFDPSSGIVVTQGHHLAGLHMQDGMQTVTSKDALLNAIGAANGLKTDYAPSSLNDEQALSYGEFLLYNPNDTVFDSNGKKTTLGQLANRLMQGEGVATPDALAPVTLASLSGEWWNTRTPSQGQQGTNFTLLEGVAANGDLIDLGPANPTVRHGYADWQSNTGFDNGYMMAQPHWVTSASGVVQTGSAYFVDTKPYDHWYDWDNLKGDLQMAAMVVGGIAAMIALPESAPLWMLLLSEAADAGFALSAAVGTANSLKTIFATPGGARNWVNWLQLSANVFGGAASGMGALARSATMAERLAAAAPAFREAASVSTVARDTDALEVARAQIDATLNGGRLIRTFDDTWVSRLMARPLVASESAMLRTLDSTAGLRALQESAAFRFAGVAAMTTNAASMSVQAWQLAKAGSNASMQDWLNLITSAGLMASGIGVERMRAGDPKVNAARVTAINERLPDGVSLLASGKVQITPGELAALDARGANVFAKLIGQAAFVKAINEKLPDGVQLLASGDVRIEPGALANFGSDDASVIGKVTGNTAVTMAAGMIEQLRTHFATTVDTVVEAGASGTGKMLTPEAAKAINDSLPSSGVEITSDGALTINRNAVADQDTASSVISALFQLHAQLLHNARADTEPAITEAASTEPTSIEAASTEAAVNAAGELTEMPLPNERTVTPSAAELDTLVYGDDAAPAGHLQAGSTSLLRLAGDWGLEPAGNEYEEEGFVVPLRVLMSAGFSTSPVAGAFFGPSMDGDGLTSRSQRWIADEVVPALADMIVQAGTEDRVIPRLFTSNIDVIVGWDGHLVDVVVNDLGLGSGALPDSGAGIGSRTTSDAYLNSAREVSAESEPLFAAIAAELFDAVQDRIPEEWRNDPAHQDAIRSATDSTLSPAARMVAARAVLLAYWADHPEAIPSNGDGETGPAGSVALALATPIVSQPGAGGHAHAGDGNASSAVSNGTAGTVTRDAGSNGQRARGQQQAFDEANGKTGQKVTRAVPDQQQSRNGNARQQEKDDEEAQRQSTQPKAAMPAKPAAAMNGSAVPTSTDEVSGTPAAKGPVESANVTPTQGPTQGPTSGQKITTYDVKHVISVINARFRGLILPGREPDGNQVALLGPAQFAQAARQAEDEGRGSFSRKVLGFTVVNGTMKIAGRDVRVVLPALIAPENVPASSVLGHEMLHQVQSPKFVAWARALNRRLGADARVRANGWFNIKTDEGLTELYNVKMFGGASAPDEANPSYAHHVYESINQGYKRVLYGLDGAVNEVVVSRMGDDLADRLFTQNDPVAQKKYEAEMFDVYRNPPKELLELRDFVQKNIYTARSGDGVDNANSAYGIRGPASGPEKAGEPDAATNEGTAAEQAANAATSKFLARIREKLARSKEADAVAFAEGDVVKPGGGSTGDKTRRAIEHAAAMAAREAKRITDRVPALRRNRPPRVSETQPGAITPTAPAAFRATSGADNLATAYGARNVQNFHLLGGALRAAKAVRDGVEEGGHIVVVTGFSVEAGMPETDGPPGTAYFARTIEKISDARVADGGKPIRVTVVTDTANEAVTRAALDAMGAGNVAIEVFDAPYGPATQDGTPYDSGAVPSAEQFIGWLEPDLLLAIELPAQTTSDGPINMRGKSVKPFNSARDALFIAANERGITTCGVGDGGNEVGVTQKMLEPWVQQDIPKVTLADGTALEFESAVKADNAVTWWNSSAGGQAIAISLLGLEGRLDLAPSAADYGAAIEACARAGAVDGVTRLYTATVDGVSALTHMAAQNALIAAAADEHGKFVPDRPTILVGVDSSDGVLVAYKELLEEVSTRTGRAVQLVLIADHGHAPYGNYKDDPETLALRVRQMMETADAITSAAAVVMACNTAHSPHYRGEVPFDERARPVVNLIETTANMIVQEGGAHPAVLATATTIETHMYRDQVREVSGGQVEVQERAAPNWADFVNKGESHAADLETRAKVRKDVKDIIGLLDAGTTSVWLCCTHYPALTEQIRAALDERGMADVKIVNPMTEHGRVARAALGWEPLPDGVQPLVRNPPPIVLTTGDLATVRASAVKWTNDPRTQVIPFETFGADADLSAVYDALARPKLGLMSRALATIWNSGGELHHGSPTHIFTPGAVEAAAEALDPASGPTLILVGAHDGAADGVLGASVLGSGLAQSRPDNVYVVPDAVSAESVRVAHEAAGAGAPKIEIFTPGDDPGRAAVNLLDRVGPASVVAVKVYGRNADGQYHTTQGVRIEPVPLDEILIQANERDLATVGVANAPAYAGWATEDRFDGFWFEVRPVAASGERPAFNPGSVVTSKYPVTGPTAAIASDGLLGALEASGQLGDVLLTRTQFSIVTSVARDRDRLAGDPASDAPDQHLDDEGQRGPMTEGMHELMLALRGRNAAPPEVARAPVAGGGVGKSPDDPGQVAFAEGDFIKPKGDGDPPAGDGGETRATGSTAGNVARRAKELVTDPSARKDAKDQLASASMRQMERVAERLSHALKKNALTRNTGTAIDNLLAAFDKRGLSKFFMLDGVGRAAKALSGKQKIGLVTGFSVTSDADGNPMPETDGPPGTAFLARVLQVLGDARRSKGGKPIEVTVITDTANERVTRASLNAIGASDVKIVLFDTPYGPATQGVPYESGARPDARRVLQQLDLDALVAVELPAHTRSGGPINMRGVSVAPINSARDALVEEANELGIATVGVGDGGNEAGVVQKTLEPGAQQDIPMVTLPDGEQLEFRSAVPTDVAVTAWNSSFGAQAIGVAMAALEGRLDLVPDGAAYEKTIQACARAGAIDGVSRVRAASVDGMSALTHAAFSDALIAAARDADGVYLPDRPKLVIVYDSSNGAFVAAPEIEKELSGKTGRAVQLVYVVDHGNAPFGPKDLTLLTDLVSKALQTGDEIPSAELVLMACNTAHGPNYGGLMSLDDESKLPVLDLIKTTSEMMKAEGGAHPALLATLATVNSKMYGKEVSRITRGKVNVQEVGAPNWADFVNEGKSDATDPKTSAAVQRDVKEIIQQLDADITSVWLCCTHYPALTKQIRAALDERGMTGVKIFNPMTEHAAIARARLGWKPLPDGVAKLVRNPAPIVITTGDAESVLQSAQRWMGREDPVVIPVESFGANVDLSGVHDALRRTELRPISCALAALWFGGGELHHGSEAHIYVPNGAEIAADALEPASGPTMILVGAEEGAADGVVGASVLGSGLARAHPDNVYVVPDARTAYSVRVAHRTAGAGDAKIEIFEPGDNAPAAAAALLERVGPASVVAVKVHGRNADGRYYTTQGAQFDAVPLDEVLVQAGERDLATVGVGDAPVYAGLHTKENEGPWYEVLPVAGGRGRRMVNPGSVVTSKYPVTGPTATVASDGLLGALQAAGQVEDVLLTLAGFEAVAGVGRGYDRMGGDPKRNAPDQHLSDEGLRGPMSRALHELVLVQLDANEPPDEVPLDPAPGPGPAPDTPQRGSDEQTGQVAFAEAEYFNQGGEGPKLGGTDDAGKQAAAGEVTSASASAATPPPAAMPAPAETGYAVSAAQWATLLPRLNKDDLCEGGDVYAYLVQPSGDPNAASAPVGIDGKLIGWGRFQKGARNGRWFGQGPVDGPSVSIDKSRLNPAKIPSDWYVVISRRALDNEDVRAGRFPHSFPDARLTDDPAAIALPDTPQESDGQPGQAAFALATVINPAAGGKHPAVGDIGGAGEQARADGVQGADDRGKAGKAPVASGATSKAAKSSDGGERKAASATAKPAAGAKPMRWARIGTTLGLAAGGAAAMIAAADNIVLPAATASLCFIYRATVTAERTRLGTLISRHVTGLGATDPDPHLDWLDTWLVKHGAKWGISRGTRQQYASAIETLRANSRDPDALATLAPAPAQLYMPGTVAGRVNETMQSMTLAANVAINGTYVLKDGTGDGVVPFLTNLGFGLSNFVLADKTLTRPVSALLRTAKERVTVRAQEVAQAAVMTGYSLSTIPWAWSDFEVGSPIGIIKGGLDVAFGMGASGQAINDARKLVTGDAGTLRIVGRVHPLMILGAAAVTRFALQLATLPPPVAQVQSNGQGQQQGSRHGKPPATVTKTPAPGASPSASAGSHHGKPGAGSKPGSPGRSGSGQPGKTGKPEVVEVQRGQSLWTIAEKNLDEILSASSREHVEPQGENAQTAAALQQLLQLNPKFEADPDRIFSGQTVELNGGAPK
jgi:glutamate racemase